MYIVQGTVCAIIGSKATPLLDKKGGSYYICVS